MNISHAIQGDRTFQINFTRTVHCSKNVINFPRKLTFLLKMFYAGNAHAMKAKPQAVMINLTYIFFAMFFLFFYSIRDCLFILIFRFKQSAYCTGNTTSLLINTLYVSVSHTMYVCAPLCVSVSRTSYIMLCISVKDTMSVSHTMCVSLGITLYLAVKLCHTIVKLHPKHIDRKCLKSYH